MCYDLLLFIKNVSLHIMMAAACMAAGYGGAVAVVARDKKSEIWGKKRKRNRRARIKVFEYCNTRFKLKMGNGIIATAHHDVVRQHLIEKGEASIIFHMILFDDHARDALHNFLRQEFSTENLVFYEAVENLKYIAECADSDDFFLFFDAFDVIMHRFIRKGAHDEINIPQAIKDELLKVDVHRIKSESLHDMRKAQKEIIDMIAGCLPRFEESEQFQEYLAYTPPRTMPMALTSSKETNNTLFTAVSEKQRAPKLLVPGFHPVGIARTIDQLQSNGELIPTTLMVRQPQKVLIVEHNSMIGKLLVRYLQPRYDVTLALTGGEALERLLVAHHDFETVLISIEDLGDRTGIDVIASYLQMNSYLGQLRRKKTDVSRHKTTIIGMANERHHKLKVKALSTGFDTVLLKPFSLDDFRNAKGERHRVMSRINHFVDTTY